MTISLPLPDRRIRPNGRSAHWAAKARCIKRARARARLETFAVAPAVRSQRFYGYQIRAYFSTRRFWDIDNILGAAKPYLDGIADALGVDDITWALVGDPAIERLVDRDRPRLEITFHPAASHAKA